MCYYLIIHGDNIFQAYIQTYRQNTSPWAWHCWTPGLVLSCKEADLEVQLSLCPSVSKLKSDIPVRPITRQSILGSDGMTKSNCSLFIWLLSECLHNVLRVILKSSLSHHEVCLKLQGRTENMVGFILWFQRLLEAPKFDLQIKVGWVLKNSGNSLLNGHWDYPFWTKESREYQVWIGLPNFKKSSPKPTFIYRISHRKLGLGLKGQSTFIFY